MAGKGTKSVDPSRWTIFRDRAEYFLKAVQYLVDDPALFRDALGSAAVHSAISFSDAILVRNVGQRGTDQHGRAHRELSALVLAKKLNPSGLDVLKSLLRLKAAFEYSEKAISLDDAKSAAEKSLRFAAWAYATFPELVPSTQGENRD